MSVCPVTHNTNFIHIETRWKTGGRHKIFNKNFYGWAVYWFYRLILRYKDKSYGPRRYLLVKKVRGE